MTNSELKIVKEIISNTLRVDESEIVPEANLVNDFYADSLDLMELVLEFEKEFNISIPDDLAERLETVGDIIRYLDMYLPKSWENLKERL